MNNVISLSPDITIQQYDNRIHINGGKVDMPSTAQVGQLWYNNDHIAVWNGYSWIRIDDTQTTNIGTSFRLSKIIQWANEKMLAEAEEAILIKEYPEILDAYTEYKNLIDSAKLIAKMRNSPLAQSGS